jgi:sugar phosphate permease
LSHIQVGTGIYNQGWRWIFIIEGLATIVAGVLAFFTLGECKSLQLPKINHIRHEYPTVLSSPGEVSVAVGS